jgi:predicted NAD/FAD-binding protein
MKRQIIICVEYRGTEKQINEMPDGQTIIKGLEDDFDAIMDDREARVSLELISEGTPNA